MTTRGERLRFLIVGAWNTLIGYLIFVSLHFIAGRLLGVMGTLIVSFCISLPHSYLTQRILVFRARDPWPRQFARFLVANGVILLANMILLPFALFAFGVGPLIAQAISTVLSIVFGYFAHKHFSFVSSS